MRVRCIALLPTPEQADKMKGVYFPGKQTFPVELGKEYTVFGLYSEGGTPWINLELSWYLCSVPLCLFEIVDARVSRTWEVRLADDGSLAMWPPSFFQEYYFDDLFEGVPEVVSDFETVKRAIYSEVDT